jgi:hypothetical protein
LASPRRLQDAKKIRTCAGLFTAKKIPLRGLTLATQTLQEVKKIPLRGLTLATQTLQEVKKIPLRGLTLATQNLQEFKKIPLRGLTLATQTLQDVKKFPLRGLTLATQTLTEVQNFPPPADALGFASEITRRQKNSHLRRACYRQKKFRCAASLYLHRRYKTSKNSEKITTEFDDYLGEKSATR